MKSEKIDYLCKCNRQKISKIYMFKRKAIEDLRIWAKKTDRKPLILRGARQVGKTTLIHAFGKEFDHYIALNLEKKEDSDLFKEVTNAKNVFQVICFIKHVKYGNGKTLLFIDEIQENATAVAMLRYFYEDMPELYVIAAGSRLQTLLKQHISFPVGRVDYLSLMPCSFEEYLTATGDEQIANALTDCELPNALHEQVMEKFTRYSLIGGMPEAVAHYARNGDLAALNDIYEDLLRSFDEDVEKYAPNQKQTAVIRHLLKTGWAMAGQAITLGNFGNSSYNAKDVREGFDTLQRAFLMELVYPLTTTQLPAIPSLKRSPKLIWLDTGLVNYAANVQHELITTKDLMSTWRGYLAEQIVAQEMQTQIGYTTNRKRMFWIRDKKGSTAEVDYAWQDGTQLIPIEVKAGTNSHLRSIHSFIEESNYDFAIRIWSGPLSLDEEKTIQKRKPFRLLNLPFYHVGEIAKYIAKYH